MLRRMNMVCAFLLKINFYKELIKCQKQGENWLKILKILLEIGLLLKWHRGDLAVKIKLMLLI